ncbi:MAG: hypothetical protein ACM3ZS_08585 [Nitrososphaerota archaeon]
MKKDVDSLVKNVAEMGHEISQMSVDKINEMAPQPTEKELRLTAKQKASEEGVPFIEPQRVFKAFTAVPEKFKKAHAYSWEYVKGIYENYVINGEPLKFRYNGEIPGEDDAEWVIPCNKPVYVPRFIAKHLEECQKYHSFSQVDGNSDPRAVASHEVESMRWFAPTGTHFRGRFRAIGAFS